MIEKYIMSKLFKALDHIQFGELHLTLPNGQIRQFQGASSGPKADIAIHDMRMLTALSHKGDIGLAESYRDGLWDSSDLAALFIFALKNEAALNPLIYGTPWSQLAARVAYLFTRNTLKGSARNIQAHYDLSNAFYELWLDPSMTYSAAIFSNGTNDLTQAQHQKYDRILERINDSGSILEVGCGWGGFAERAIGQGDYAIKCLTLSHEQFSYANNRLAGQAEIALEDYRAQGGKFDNIVSIEMFEAVGESFWPVYFGQLKNLLAEKGKAVVQTITIDEQYFDKYRKTGDAIRSFIFPGGLLPSFERFKQESEKAGLHVSGEFAFGQDYARTLKQWLTTFEMKLPEVKHLGFDDAFIRMWRFYLTYCIASFSVERTNVMQIELRHTA